MSALQQSIDHISIFVVLAWQLSHASSIRWCLGWELMLLPTVHGAGDFKIIANDTLTAGAAVFCRLDIGGTSCELATPANTWQSAANHTLDGFFGFDFAYSTKFGG